MAPPADKSPPSEPPKKGGVKLVIGRPRAVGDETLRKYAENIVRALNPAAADLPENRALRTESPDDADAGDRPAEGAG